ncbi:MAG TPA: Rrf2 family transcriptional regulator [Arachidicoccus soli]|uniref:Rrf2 family transcriptional regulator n=1 Tax=Arachidicoccus soli TaxID=2341117 RepID=A0A386HME5_9BACT|nr:Rrf2 family transcriptional regulator [Arachidicoccus soli]AYD46786.1 Rrf2 family transcriptional regulator [Arachidicoccus soli]HEU0226201.1 Rrf2 family transcriptional regulator [Arachidicoccus soli]
MFSKSCEYGIKATLHIAHQSQQSKYVSLKEIAKAINSPEAFTAKILQQLTHSKIIISTRGAAGGFKINENSLEKIKLSHIVNAIDGDDIYKGCGLGLNVCNEAKPCPVHHKFKVVRESLKTMLETTSIKELSNGLNDGLTFLKR